MKYFMNEEIKEILDKLEIVARKHIIEVCEDGSKIETMPASVVDELRLNNYSAKLLLDYITNLQEENKHLKWERDSYYEDIICYIRNTMHVKDKKARKTFDKVSMDWSSSTIYLTLCELDKDLRGDE